MYKLVGKFPALDEQGNEHEIHAYKDVVETQTRGGTIRQARNMIFKTSTGQIVNMTGENTFEIVETSQRLRELGKLD